MVLTRKKGESEERKVVLLLFSLLEEKMNEHGMEVTGLSSFFP